MKTPYSSFKKGISRTITHPVTVAAVSVIWISLIFLAVVMTLNLSNIEDKLEEQLKSYADIFSADDLPIACEAQLFPFFYSADGGAVNVTDHDITDWTRLRETALNGGKLRSWKYDPSILIAELPCGLALTPVDANQITKFPRADDAELQFTGYDFKLSFARDTKGQSLYIMGRIRSSSRNMLPGQFRLRLDYADRTHQYFTLKYAGGDLIWNPWIPYHSESANNELLLDATGQYGVKFKGTWWDTDTPELKGRYFELRVDNVEMVTAFDIAAEKLDEEKRVQFRVGTHDPVPLHEETKMYQITRNLPQNIAFELFLIRGNLPPVPLARSPVHGDQTSEPRSPSLERGWLPWVDYSAEMLNLTSKLYFFVQGHEPCPTAFSPARLGTEPFLCFLEPEHDLFPYRLRAGTFLPKDKSGDRGLVLVEETPSVKYRDLKLSIFSVLLIVLLIMFLVYMNRRRKEALDRQAAALDKLRDAHSVLDQRRSELEQMNRALANYAGIFIHEGRRRLALINEKVKNILALANLQGSEEEKTIDEHFDSVTARLLQSTKVFHYREIVRRKIARHGHEPFYLIESIEGILEDYGPEIQFQWTLEGRKGTELSATGLDDPKKDDSPDFYFVQAMENIIVNAVRYHIRGTPITISLETEHADAIIRVSNLGPTVPEDKLASVFEFGTRFSGAGRQPAEAEEPTGAGRGHFGVGLFITKQVIEGYQGTCRMENDPDGTGVIVTVRVPCS